MPDEDKNFRGSLVLDSGEYLMTSRENQGLSLLAEKMRDSGSKVAIVTVLTNITSIHITVF